MGVIGYYCGKYAHGKQGCLKAIEFGLNSELDTNNLKFYNDREKKKNIQTPVITEITKKDFMKKAVDSLKIKFPRMKTKKLHSMAAKKWKTRNK